MSLKYNKKGATKSIKIQNKTAQNLKNWLQRRGLRITFVILDDVFYTFGGINLSSS